MMEKQDACIRQEESKIKVLMSVVDMAVCYIAEHSIKDLYFWIEKVCDPTYNFCEVLNISLPQVRLSIMNQSLPLINILYWKSVLRVLSIGT